MGDNVLERFTSRLAKIEPECDPEFESVEDLCSFGWLRGVKDKIGFIEFRKKDGGVIALGYPWLERVELDGEALTLYFTSETVRIMGRNFQRQIRPGVSLLSGILRGKVPWIQEADRPTILSADKYAPVVESIAFVNS